jgi:hypothetical protein
MAENVDSPTEAAPVVDAPTEAAPAKAEPFIVGLRLADVTVVQMSGVDLPYMVADTPYLSLFEVTGLKERGKKSDVPHPMVVAEALAGIAPTAFSLEAGQSITAVNPTRRGLLMSATRELATFADSIKATLDEAGFRVADYPLALLLGNAPIGDVKAQRGKDIQFTGEIVLVGIGGGVVDVNKAEAAVDADAPADDAEPADAPATDNIVAGAFAAPTISLADIDIDPANTAPWEGLIALEGVETGDGRFLNEDALTWRDLPLPLMMMTENPVAGTGHDGAKLVGRIDKIERRGKELHAAGVIDLGSAEGAEAFRLMDAGMMKGVSADIDSVAWDAESADPLEALLGGEGQQRVAAGRVMGATLCVFPALSECSCWLVDGESTIDTADDPEALAASAGGFPSRIVWYTPLGDDGALVASAGYPVEPPAAWFSDPAFVGPTALTVSKDGEVKGHVAVFGSCHIGFGGGRCTEVPRSYTNYAGFLTASVLTAEGALVKTGQLTVDTVHPDLKLQASDAQSFYAHSGSGAADVAAGEDQFGIWIHGSLRPDCTANQVRALRGSDMSPDWRTIQANGRKYPREMCALLAVNNSGFKALPALVASAGSDAGDWIMPGKTAARIVDGEVEALVASSMIAGENMLEAVMDEVAEMRTQLGKVTGFLRPAMVTRAREQAVQLGGSKDRHPAARTPKPVDELRQARVKMARAKALRLSTRK